MYYSLGFTYHWFRIKVLSMFILFLTDCYSPFVSHLCHFYFSLQLLHLTRFGFAMICLHAFLPHLKQQGMKKETMITIFSKFRIGNYLDISDKIKNNPDIHMKMFKALQYNMFLICKKERDVEWSRNSTAFSHTEMEVYSENLSVL